MDRMALVLQKSTKVEDNINTADNPLNKTTLYSCTDDGPFIVKMYVNISAPNFEKNK